MTRADAWNLLCEYTKTDSLRKHALAVEASMRAYARKYREDEELWGITGMLHDFDYEMYPNADQHPFIGNQILGQNGYPETIRRAIMGHATYTGIPRDTLLAKCLYACDELCGFITAVALVRPGKKLGEVEVRSVIKKLKDKSFARSVNREDIVQGVTELGIPQEEHFQFVLQAMLSVADEIGL